MRFSAVAASLFPRTGPLTPRLAPLLVEPATVLGFDDFAEFRSFGLPVSLVLLFDLFLVPNPLGVSRRAKALARCPVCKFRT